MGALPIDTREALHLNDIYSRATCYSRNYGYYRCRSAWSRFGRWVLAGILIFVAIFFFFIILCISRRRRRRNQISSGNQPMAYSQPTNTYNQPPAQPYAPPPGVPPSYGGGHTGANQDYYGTSGVTQPTNVYTK
ncbi:hypothetical protein MFRU_037g00690 [Monilinia fructicola]|nr:hypothetical protein MFRU_037g00690 [Monilinia fructicola]